MKDNDINTSVNTNTDNITNTSVNVNPNNTTNVNSTANSNNTATTNNVTSTNQSVTQAQPDIVTSVPVVDSSTNNAVNATVTNNTSVSVTPSVSTDSEVKTTPVSTDVPSQVSSTVPSNQVPVNQTATTNQVTGSEQVTGGAGDLPVDDSVAYVDEKLKKVEINYTPPSKFKVVMNFILIILVIAFVIFLPDITTLVKKYTSNVEVEKEVITTGTLECYLNSHTANLDIDYERYFNFTDSKLESAEYIVTTRGDSSEDEEALDELATKCEHLKDNAASMDGFNIKCTASNGKFVERESLVFGSIDKDQLSDAFAEAGGTYPEFTSGQKIDDVEKLMLQQGFSCSRKR